MATRYAYYTTLKGVLDNDSVATANIIDQNVTTAKIQTLGVTGLKIAAGAVDTTKVSADIAAKLAIFVGPATATTTSTSNVELLRMTMSADSAATFDALVVGRKTDGTVVVTYRFAGLFAKPGAGTPVQQGTTQPVYTIENPGTPGTSASFLPDGGDVIVQVAGIAATTINWSGFVERTDVV